MESSKANLRIVVYQRNGDLNMYEAGFEDIDGIKNVQELRKKRKGLFHQWLEGKNVALIENEDGIMETIDSKFVEFINK